MVTQLSVTSPLLRLSLFPVESERSQVNSVLAPPPTLTALVLRAIIQWKEHTSPHATD